MKNNAKGNVMDMTQGSIMPKLVRFALPVLMGLVFQRIYNFVDVYIVGRYLGDEALAAVSIAGSGMYLIMSLMMGVTTGVSIVIAQYYGAGNENKVRETFASSIFVAIISTAVITALGMLGAKPLLRLLQTSDALMENAHTYLMIIFAGCCGTMLYNWISAVMRSLGNSVVPLVALILSPYWFLYLLYVWLLFYPGLAAYWITGILQPVFEQYYEWTIATRRTQSAGG